MAVGQERKARKSRPVEPAEFLRLALIDSTLIHCVCSPPSSNFQQGWPENRQPAPEGEGYIMSDHMFINVNCFCEPCFERLVEKGSVQRHDYTKKSSSTLFEIVTTEIIEATTERENYGAGCRITDSPWLGMYYVPFFADFGEQGQSWQAAHKNVKADDIAIVVARGLIQDGCQTRWLQLDGIHYNDPGFGPVGYKALAYALSINKTVERIDFWHDFGEGCGYCPTAKGYRHHWRKNNGQGWQDGRQNGSSGCRRRRRKGIATGDG